LHFRPLENKNFDKKKQQFWPVGGNSTDKLCGATFVPIMG
jgi:hypothetical protein